MLDLTQLSVCNCAFKIKIGLLYISVHTLSKVEYCGKFVLCHLKAAVVNIHPVPKDFAGGKFLMSLLPPQSRQDQAVLVLFDALCYRQG